MTDRVVPMIHVPDVRATVDWYHTIGFTIVETFDNGRGGLSFAILSFGSSQVMFNQDGQPSTRSRREVDLYVYTDNVDDLYGRLRDRIAVVEGPHDTPYGMREFIIRDLNRFWLTFGQASVFEVLMNGVREGNTEVVRVALASSGLRPETLTAALVVALAGDHRNAEIAEMLKKAGAVAPPEVDAETLQSYVGEYESAQGLKVSVIVEDGTLFVAPAGQQPLSLMAVDKTTFRPIALDDGTVTFNIGAGKTLECVFRLGPNTTRLRRLTDIGRP